jgi:uncharacterized membrane protein
MKDPLHDLPQRLLPNTRALLQHEQHVIDRFTQRLHVSRDTNLDWEEKLTFGQWLADRVAAFGGSWTFIILFALVLLSWIVLNSYILIRHGKAFDPYPYILLNLVLSSLAALQAPVIMMSQNRQAAKDRLNAEHDYEVNLKAELEILGLHQKLDALRDQQWGELVAMQQEQIRLLTQLLEERK